MAVRWDEIIESHYLETHEGLFFAVKGLVHPPDRTLACLRYAPDAEGERVRGAQRYRRLYHFAEQEALLRSNYPAYLAFERTVGAVLQSVPHDRVRRAYDPRERLAELRAAGRTTGPLQCPATAVADVRPRQVQAGVQPAEFAAGLTHGDKDRVIGAPGMTTAEEPIEAPGTTGYERLVADCLAFAELLQGAAGLPDSALGVSGSLLIGLGRPGSDLDVTVYGIDHGLAVHRALHHQLDGALRPDLRRLDMAGQRALHAERSADTRMAFADFASVEGSKVNQGEFRGRPYFLRFVPLPEEYPERYGDRTYAPAGRATIRATVADAGLSIFTPCCYTLDEVRFEGGNAVADLREIVSFRGRFCEQARSGDRVWASGAVERVTRSDGVTWHRLVLGNTVHDTMLPAGGEEAREQ